MAKKNKNIPLILREDMKNIGYADEVVHVRPGYARNYLLPSSVAEPLTPQTVNELNQRLANRKKKLDVISEKASEIYEQIKGIALEFDRKTSQGTKLYGSVTSQEILESINEKAGTKLEMGNIAQAPRVIKQIGHFDIPVTLSEEITTKVSVTIRDTQAEAIAAQEASKKASKQKKEAPKDNAVTQDEFADSEEDTTSADETPKEDVSEEQKEA